MGHLIKFSLSKLIVKLDKATLSYTYHYKNGFNQYLVPCVMQTESKHHAVVTTNVLGFGSVIIK